MILRTPRRAETPMRFYVSLHFFRWGLHWKLRRRDVWRHFVVKLNRGSALGEKHARKMIWIGWWQSRAGVRGKLNGWRFLVVADRLPGYPRDTIPIPFFPQQPPSRGRVADSAEGRSE